MDELIEIEMQGWNALSEGTGADFFREVMVDDGVMVLPGVDRLAKRDALDGIEGAAPWSWFEMTDVLVVPLSEDAGVVTYAIAAQRDDEPVYEALMSSTYTRRDGPWKLVAHQQTPHPRT